jgi:hypothetical protein
MTGDDVQGPKQAPGKMRSREMGLNHHHMGE